MTHHDLKTWPSMFEAVWTGDKTFEVRIDDRGYQKGDTVTLREWDRRAECSCFTGPTPPGQPQPEHGIACEKYSGRRIDAAIGHVLASTAPRGNQRGFNGNGWVVFSVCSPERYDGRPAALSPRKICEHIASAPRPAGS